MAELTAELRAVPLLARLSDEQLARVARLARPLELDTGQLLFRQGDPAERFYLVRRGQLRLFRLAPSGAEKIIELVGSGQTFAEALMFLNLPRYPVTAATLEPSVLLALDARDFACMLRESVDTCFLLLGGLSQRLRALINEIDSLTLHTANGRVARYLLARIPPERRALRLETRKGILASRLSIQPETFSRAMRALGERGLVRMQGAEVTILDRAGLAAVAEVEDPGEQSSCTGPTSPPIPR